MRTRPFREGDTFATFRGLVENTVREIDSLENEYVLKASPTELEDYYVSKVTVAPLSLDADNHYIEVDLRGQTPLFLSVRHASS